jgi:hypothetical protein
VTQYPSFCISSLSSVYSLLEFPHPTMSTCGAKLGWNLGRIYFLSSFHVAYQSNGLEYSLNLAFQNSFCAYSVLG